MTFLLKKSNVGVYFDPTEKSINLTEPGNLVRAAHEMTHAMEHIPHKADLTDSAQRPGSELHAFENQEDVGQELGVDNDLGGRSGYQQARTYVGAKKATQYPGTLETGMTAMTDYQDARFLAALDQKTKAHEQRAVVRDYERQDRADEQQRLADHRTARLASGIAPDDAHSVPMNERGDVMLPHLKSGSGPRTIHRSDSEGGRRFRPESEPSRAEWMRRSSARERPRRIAS